MRTPLLCLRNWAWHGLGTGLALLLRAEAMPNSDIMRGSTGVFPRSHPIELYPATSPYLRSTPCLLRRYGSNYCSSANNVSGLGRTARYGTCDPVVM